MQVSAKALCGEKFTGGWIDAGRGWRYSQAQIPDLVAYANPRFSKAAQSIGSGSPCARKSTAKHINSDGCKARLARGRGDALGLAAVLPVPLYSDTLSTATPNPALMGRARLTSTSQRRTGGHRNL
jgi:hypothetical protein